MAPSEQAIMRGLVGAATFARGQVYAKRGAVQRREWQDDGTKLTGQVRGSAVEPYLTSVAVTRSPTGRMTTLTATCTCPVGINCKHAVALLLAGTANSPSPPTDPPRHRGAGHPQTRRRPAGWEKSLLGLLAADGTDTTTTEPGIGLQFELVASRPAGRPGGGSGQASGPRVRLRPVVPGQAGNWVRSGTSWASLDYFSYGRVGQPPVRPQHILILKELLALSHTPVRRAYSYSYSSRGEDAVWLETIDSRRVWDLLAEARSLGMPLLQAGGRPPRPVTFHPGPARVAMEVTRTARGLTLEPSVSVDDERMGIGASLLVGRPAHGIVWWDEEPSGSPRLSVAPLASPAGDALRRLLVDGVTLRVPNRDEDRFLREMLPVLRRQVAVRSGDESVALPEEEPPILVLTVRDHGNHRVGLAWEWARRIGDTEWRQPLGEVTGGGPEREQEDAIVDAARRSVRAVPELVELTPLGERLAPATELAGMSAVGFLTEVLPAVRQAAGVAVEVDDSVLDYREAGEPPAVVLSGSGSSSGADWRTDDWFDLTVTVTVEGEEVPFAELFVALAEERSHLILPSGTYFSLDREDLRQLAELIAEARSMSDADGDSIRLSRFQASLWEELCRLGIVTEQARAWEESVRALTDANDRTDHPVPASMDATLRPYQHAGFNWLAFLFEHGLGGVLADDMGLGKTLQALALICHVHSSAVTDAPFLVVAPTSVVANWAAECRRFTPGLEAVTITETQARRGVKLATVAERADIVITSYSLFRLEYGDYDAIEWAGMFLDEAQFAKNHRSQTYQRARMLPVRFKVAMTGTPMENNLMELWSLLSITAPGLFANPDRFAEHYRIPIERQANGDRLAQLRRRIRPLMVRRTKEQVAPDLPDKQEQILELDLDPKHRRVYQTHLQRERQKVLGLIGDMQKNRFEIFRSLTLLRQVSLDASLIDARYAKAKVPSTKLDALMQMVDDIVADGHRVLVFSQFTRFLALARARLDAARVEHCYLDGRTRRRSEVLSRFREGRAPVFLISLKAGGFGLNLTEADYCILLDPWWNPATEAQAVDRIHRIGQTRKVMVYRLVAKDTIEEKVMALKARKAALFANVVDAGGFESGALTADDIRGLLS